MRRRLQGAEAADDQRGGDKQPALHEHREAHRQADLQQLGDRRPARPFEARVQLQIGITGAARQMQTISRGLHPQRGRGGDAQPVRAQFRCAVLAEHQRIAERKQQQQTAQADHHGRLGQRHALAEIAEGEEQRQRRCAGRNPAQKAQCLRAHVLGDAGKGEQPARIADEDPQPAAQHQGQPQRLPEHRADLAAAASAIELGDGRRNRHQHADQDQDRH